MKELRPRIAPARKENAVLYEAVKKERSELNAKHDRLAYLQCKQEVMVAEHKRKVEAIKEEQLAKWRRHQALLKEKDEQIA